MKSRTILNFFPLFLLHSDTDRCEAVLENTRINHDLHGYFTAAREYTKLESNWYKSNLCVTSYSVHFTMRSIKGVRCGMSLYISCISDLLRCILHYSFFFISLLLILFSYKFH